MEPERWNRMQELFEAALAQPENRRVEFLHQACADDSRLLSEVEELLEHVENGSPLEQSPGAGVRAQALSPGNRLGNFEVLGLLGKGGMGEVYRARDLRLGRDVAIKILPPEFAGDAERAARFGREARVTSALNHPNIASVYDVPYGTTSRGFP